MFSVFSLALFFLLSLFSSEAFSFKVPETLRYELTWAGIKAGEATLEISDDGRETKITSIARSAKFISVFYPVEDVVESRLSADPGANGHPLNYRLKLREGRHRKNKEVIFDRDNRKATYIDYIDKERKEFELPLSAFDALSGFYRVRTMKLEVGKSAYITVFDNKKVWDVEVQVLRKERVEVPAGTFDTIVIKPLLKSEGIFARKGDVYIWLTDDERRVPVLLRSKVKIGSINASLVGGNY